MPCTIKLQHLHCMLDSINKKNGRDTPKQSCIVGVSHVNRDSRSSLHVVPISLWLQQVISARRMMLIRPLLTILILLMPMITGKYILVVVAILYCSMFDCLCTVERFRDSSSGTKEHNKSWKWDRCVYSLPIWIPAISINLEDKWDRVLWCNIATNIYTNSWGSLHKHRE